MDDTQAIPPLDAADAQALQALVPDLVADCPDLYAMAYQVAKTILLQHHITDIEPDKVYWHRFHAAQSSAKTFTGWQHVFETPRESLTFPQLVMQRFSVHDQDNSDLLDINSGFYRAGPGVGNYDETNEIRLHSREVLLAFWDIDFSERYRAAVAAFWNIHSVNFRALAKCTFIAKAIEGYELGHLSREHFSTVLRAAAGNISRPLDRQMLMDESPSPSGLSIRQFCIDHFVSTDILSITDDAHLNILYVPGEARSFHCFSDVEGLHRWLVNEVKDAEGRERMLMHFKQQERDILQERPTSLMHKLANLSGIGLIIHTFQETPVDNVGLNHAYDVLPGPEETAHHHLLHYRGEIITGDAFTHLNQSTHARMISDGDFLLHSNGEMRKNLWIGYLNAFNHTFGPMAALAWPAALVVIGAGIANVGLHIDQAVNGHTPAERKAAVMGAILGSVDVLFNLPFLRGATELAELAELAESVEVEEFLTPEHSAAAGADTTATLSPGIEASTLQPTDADILAPFETNDVLDGYSPITAEGQYQGIYQPETGGNYVAIGDRFYQVRYSNEQKMWSIVDPVNPHSFYRNIPVRLNAGGEWQALTRVGLNGGGRFSDWFSRAEPPLPDFDAPATAYDVPQPLKPALQQAALGNSERGALDDRYANFNGADDEFESFKRLRRTLHQAAVNFYADVELPARPEIPTFHPTAKPKDIIKTIFNRAPGLVVGESHSSVGSKQFLIENMKVLRNQNVKTLYMEHLLTDFHQADLDVFNRTGVMSDSLETYLKDLDANFVTDTSGKFNFEQVVRTAQKRGMRIQAIDCMTSYRSEGIEDADPLFRQKMMNYFAQTIISADQAARGTHRWVALVGNSHANTFEGVAGISELQGGIGLRVTSVGTDEFVGITPDPGVSDIAQPGEAAGFAKNDLLLQIIKPGEIANTQLLDQNLSSPGMFTVSNSTDRPLLVHRSRLPATIAIGAGTPPATNGPLVQTVLLRDGEQFYINRDAWPWISGQRFATCADFIAALGRNGMTYVRIPGI